MGEVFGCDVNDEDESDSVYWRSLIKDFEGMIIWWRAGTFKWRLLVFKGQPRLTSIAVIISLVKCLNIEQNPDHLSLMRRCRPGVLVSSWCLMFESHASRFVVLFGFVQSGESKNWKSISCQSMMSDFVGGLVRKIRFQRFSELWVASQKIVSKKRKK